MKSPLEKQIVNKKNHLRKPLDGLSVCCGDFSEPSLGFRIFSIRRSHHADQTNINGTG